MELSAFNMSNAGRAERGRVVSGLEEVVRQAPLSRARPIHSGQNSRREYRACSLIYQQCLVDHTLYYGTMLASFAAPPRPEECN